MNYADDNDVIGDKTVQCGRKVDSFKFWLMWKSRGHQGMAKVVDIAFDNARLLEIFIL